MSDVASIKRTIRSRPTWFWVYAALAIVVLFALMFVAADRLTDPARDGSSFTPIEATGERAVPENEFLPADRPVSDCISAIQKPGCGSEARGGWRQTLVFVAILIGLALIAWRIVAGARTAQRRRSGRETEA